ncbi:MFS transporter [Microbispora sp. NPDC049125]|uniref:MFS transporter n=1 Tax=Microbispora sp. NPDC049125 TaxID=3154929 RepID=UPI0034661AA9
MRANLPLRLARSAAFAVVCVILGVGAHRFAGGAGPDPGVLLVGVLVVMAGATALAGRERPPAAVIGLLVAAQVFLHELLGTAGIPPVSGDPHSHALSVRVGMLTAHLTAALLTGWWLSRGETALWSILRRLGAGALRALAPLIALLRADLSGARGPRLVRFARAGTPRPRCLLRHAVVRRGPPVLPVF